MRPTEIRIAGFGGQGVVLSATIIGRAACIYANHYAAMTQSFGHRYPDCFVTGRLRAVRSGTERGRAAAGVSDLKCTVHAIPTTRLAEGLGNRIVRFGSEEFSRTEPP